MAFVMSCSGWLFPKNLYLPKWLFRAYLLSPLTTCPRVAPGLNIISLRSMLSASMRVSTEPRDRFYQLAASTILVIYGVSNISESRWTIFFCGGKRIARSIFAGSHNYDGESAFLLDWVYGQDTLSMFSLLFWPRKDIARRNRGKDLSSQPRKSGSRLSPCAFASLI